MKRYSLKIRGIVQGVGFRPFLFRLAESLSITGYVRNTSEGVYAEIEGENSACDEFIARLKPEAPPLSRIDGVEKCELPVCRDDAFVITESQSGSRNTLISPDIGICDDCLADIFDKTNRRYRYPFTNCTNCGPRFTIIRDIPYDRKNTTMAVFKQCPDCFHEYSDPRNRRFHAQPNACPVCGPKLSFLREGKEQAGDPVAAFNGCMASGEIAAVKGLGGYHLACDAHDGDAVQRLRERKVRYDKPFAVMMRDLETVRKNCCICREEEELLTSQRKPIVLLKKRTGCAAAESVAPGNAKLGVMLPYTPLHYLLMENNEMLVMTSANISDYPMIYDDAEAREVLPSMADAVLTHNRQIFRRMDDSVCAVISGAARMIRRARGYAPEPVLLKGNKSVILALGAQQKNTFCLVNGENAFLSGHIGDLDDAGTEAFYSSEIESFIRIFGAEPELIACDLHPDYVSTKYAAKYEKTRPILAIQHHRAHFASVLAEHNFHGEALGLIFDGTGYGDDGTLWGGEALMGGIGSSLRIGHLLCAPLPGGEAAVRDPWRMGLSVVNEACGRSEALEFFSGFGDKAEFVLRAAENGINSPSTTGMGRLFDAVAAIAGVRTRGSYEGQAAIELEQALDPSESGSYGFDLAEESGKIVFDWRQIVRDAVSDAKEGVSAGGISAKFHRAIIRLMEDVADFAGKTYGIKVIALSGGVFQNAYLLKNGIDALEKRGFAVLSNEKVPANDGGIAYGQAAAASQIAGGEVSALE